MRDPTCAALGALSILWLCLSPGPVLAQVQQNNPNAANESLTRQSDLRALQQQRVSDLNTLNMQVQRNVQYRPYEPSLGGYGLHRGRGRYRGRARGGLATGVCVGC